MTFHARSDYGLRFTIAGETIIQWDGEQTEESGTVELEEGRHYPIELTYIHNRGERKFMDVTWSWAGRQRTEIARSHLLHSPAQVRACKQQVPREFLPGHHSIGFRVVLGAL